MNSEILVKLPGSKSIAARALILDKVLDLHLDFLNIPDCDDTRQLQSALSALDAGAREFNLGAGGTSLRFFLALVASMPGFDCVVDCDDALRSRPIVPLVDALREAGASVEYVAKPGECPLRIRGARLSGRGISLHADISSQFVTALTLVSPLWHTPCPIPDKIVSRPYLDMTVRMLSQFQGLKPGSTYKIESDWSAASYFFEWALLFPGMPLRLRNVTPPQESLQGDARCLELFSILGVTSRFDNGDLIIEGSGLYPRRVEFCLVDNPDLAPAIITGLSFAGIHFDMTGIEHLQYKESNRIETLKCELAKAGFILRYEEGRLIFDGAKCPFIGDFDSHGDHRIAMALGAAGMLREDIARSEAVSKSFPGFFGILPPLPY